jgi:hypothetical protein
MTKVQHTEPPVGMYCFCQRDDNYKFLFCKNAIEEVNSDKFYYEYMCNRLGRTK